MNNKKMLDFQTIAVDFDGTLCYSKWPELDQPNQALIEYLQEWGYAFVLILAFLFIYCVLFTYYSFSHNKNLLVKLFQILLLHPINLQKGSYFRPPAL